MLNTIVLTMVMVFSDAISDVLLARAMKKTKQHLHYKSRECFSVITIVFSVSSFWGAVLMMAMHFISFLALLTYVQISIVVPLGSLVYIISALGARFFLSERISIQRWIGIVFVGLGVALVSCS
ncbi:putative EamA domain-containing protein [Azospirillaceae bacterium]